MTRFQKSSFRRLSGLALAASFVLAGGCGGGGGGSTAPASGSFVQGIITGFGSVFVNGVEYETSSSTSITIDGIASGEEALGVGMRVTLEGRVNADGLTGTATSIAFEDELEGVVQSNQIAAGENTGTLVAMGYTVHLDALTVFESNLPGVVTPGDITPGMIIEVSGSSAGTGTIFATRVEVKASDISEVDEIEVKGVIAALDPAAMTFMIGSMLVDYSGASLDFTLADGLAVEVKSETGFGAGGELIADEIELEGDVDDEMGEGGELEIHGHVTVALSDGTFMVDNQIVRINDDTEFEHGDVNALVLGARVEVEGTLNADNELVAEKIEFDEDDDAEIKAYVEAVGTDSVTLLGLTIGVDSQTIMVDNQDDNGSPEQYFDLADIMPGDRLEITVVRRANALVAAKIEREDEETPQISKLEGNVETVNGTTIVVLGVSVDVSGVAGFTPQVGDKVKVEGPFANGFLNATSGETDN